MAPVINDIKIAQININSIRNKTAEIKLLLKSFEDKQGKIILLINDTRLNDTDLLNFDGYYTLRQDHHRNTHSPGGVAAIIPNDISSCRIMEFRNLNVESVGFEIKYAGETVRIVTAYPHPGQALEPVFYDLLIKDLGENLCCVLGDLNVHLGVLDNNRPIDRMGENLLNNFESRNFHLVNDPVPTYFSQSNADYYELLDTCFLKTGGSALLWGWDCLVGETSSDHIITILTLKTATPMSINTDGQRTHSVIKEEELRSNMGNTAWPRSDTITKQEMTRMTSETVNLIINNVSKSSRTFRSKSHKPFLISDSSRLWIRLRRNLCKTRKKVTNDSDMAEYLRRMTNQCCKKVKTSLKADSILHEERLAEKMTAEPDLRKRWKFFNDFQQRNSEPVQRLGLLLPDGSVAFEDQEIAEAHASRLEETHSDANDPEFDDNWRQFVEAEVTRREAEIKPCSSPDPEVLANPVTTEELLTHLNKTKNKSAPGPDGISFKTLKSGGPTFIQHLCWLFTMLLALGFFPDQWKVGLVRMLAKAGKDLRLSKNYRPITLLNCISKLFEAVVLGRLQQEMDRARPTNRYQAGYKKSRSCQEHVLRLTEEALIAFKNKKCVFAVFLDAASAFDKVWIVGFYYKLLNFAIPSYLKRVVADFLRNRRLRVKVGDCSSRTIQMLAGTPQGAVMSPEIFKIFTDDIITDIPEAISPSQFADDLGIWATQANKHLAAQDIQSALDVISSWCRLWRQLLSSEKSVSMLFSRCRTHQDATVQVNLNGERIKEETEAKFLGVLFDNKLTWKPQVDQLISNNRYKYHLLRQLSQNLHFRNPRFILNLYEGLITPCFEFSAPCFINMAETHWQKLKSFHSKALRSILGIPRHVSYNHMCDANYVTNYKDKLQNSALRRIKGILEATPFREDLIVAARGARDNAYLTPVQRLLADDPNQ